MDYPTSKRQDKQNSKKKQSSNSVYTSKHVRITAAIVEKSNTAKQSSITKKLK
jgi:hypothetical protein